LKGLATIGWIRQIEPLLPGFNGYAAYEDGKTVANILKELHKHDYSEFIEFPPEAFFDLKWDDARASGAAFSRLRVAESGIDLVLSLGTQVSTALTQKGNFSVPILVDSISDPVGSGILASLEDSGNDYLTGGMDPDQDIRQVRLFHSVIKFKRLGILYEDSAIGRAYGAVDAVRQVADELGFTVVAGTGVLPDPEDEDDEDAWAAAEARYVRALDKLCPQVDAVYLAVQAGLSEYSLPEIVAVLAKHRTPSFIMEGKDFVRNGILLGESDSNIIAKGIFNAKKIAQILGGTKARDLPLLYKPVPHIAINLDTALKIGYDVPIDIIASADEVFATPGSSE
jgi:ABC-type uncharacterized transport system substrate-binding protein